MFNLLLIRVRIPASSRWNTTRNAHPSSRDNRIITLNFNSSYMCLSPQRCASYRCLVGFRFRPVLRHLSTLHTMHTLRNEMITVKTSHLVKQKIICTVSTILETNTQRFIKEKTWQKKQFAFLARISKFVRWRSDDKRTWLFQLSYLEVYQLPFANE